MLYKLYDLEAEVTASSTLYMWAQSAQICPTFFSFNSSAALFRTTWLIHTKELTKFGTVCDNIIIPMQLGCKQPRP